MCLVCLVSPKAKIGEGCVVLDGAIVEAAELGNFCIVDPEVKVHEGDKIEEYTHIKYNRNGKKS